MIIVTLVDGLITLGYHVSEIMTSKPILVEAPYCNRARLVFGFGGYEKDCPQILIDMVITPAYLDEEVVQREFLLAPYDPWGVWAQVWIRSLPLDQTHPQNKEPDLHDGYWQCFGNRSGGRNEYLRLCAPVIAWLTNH